MTEEEDKLSTLTAGVWLLLIGTSAMRPESMSPVIWLVLAVAIAVTGSLRWLRSSLRRQRQVAAQNASSALEVEQRTTELAKCAKTRTWNRAIPPFSTAQIDACP